MKGKIHNKDGNIVVMYKHYSSGRDNGGFEKWAWKTQFFQIDNINDYIINHEGYDVEFKRTFLGVEIDITKLKQTIRDIKINKIINE